MLMISSRRAHALARQQMEFVAGVTHELRTPLAVIGSASQNLADGVATGEEQTRRYGVLIREQGQRLSGMVEQVLRFAGLSSGRVEIPSEAVDVAGLVEQAVKDSLQDFDAAGAKLTRHVPADVPAIRGDRATLAHCLRNLLSNAAKHGAGAAVDLRAAEVGRMIEIRVEDHGPGIDPAEVSRVFEPFYRGRRATNDQIHGTGLGLSLVQKIVDAHGGTVEVSDTPGGGASFVVRLPRAGA
jgi:signal transduction histidine kinase